MACQGLHLWQAVVAFPGSGSSVRAGVKTLRLSPEFRAVAPRDDACSDGP